MITTIPRPHRAPTRNVPVEAIDIPDLWHVAMYLQRKGESKASEAVLETWYLAHDLKAALQHQA